MFERVNQLFLYNHLAIPHFTVLKQPHFLTKLVYVFPSYFFPLPCSENLPTETKGELDLCRISAFQEPFELEQGSHFISVPSEV